MPSRDFDIPKINNSVEVVDCLERFKDAVQDIPNLRCPMDNEFLIRFLKARKFDVARAVKQLECYYRMRQKHDILRSLYPSAISPTAYENGFFAVLKHRDKLGRQVLYLRVPNWNLDTTTLDELFLLNYIILEELISTQETQDNGIVLVEDQTGMTWNHLKQVTVKVIQKFVHMLDGSFPVRVKAVYVFNHPYIFNVVWLLVKPFLSPKLKKRIFFKNQEFTSLFEIMDSSKLPKSLGGDLNEDDAIDKDFFQNMLHKDEYYKRMLEFGYNNTRIGASSES